jgi:hypothetical protein
VKCLLHGTYIYTYIYNIQLDFSYGITYTLTGMRYCQMLRLSYTSTFINQRANVRYRLEIDMVVHCLEIDVCISSWNRCLCIVLKSMCIVFKSMFVLSSRNRYVCVSPWNRYICTQSWNRCLCISWNYVCVSSRNRGTRGEIRWGIALQAVKVAGSIPNAVTGIFHWLNPSGRNMALWSTQPLT